MTARPLALVGCTACGKSALALAIARCRPGVELVSIDSMQVYRGMDIGTAKPTPVEQSEVRHHLIDLVEPSVDFSVADFQRAARAAMADIARRGGRAVLVGGTGLYLRSVIDGLDIPGQYPLTRQELEARLASTHDGLADLYRELLARDPLAAARIESRNERRIVRALEVCIGSGRPFSSFGPGLDAYPDTDVAMVGVRLPRPEIDRRISERYIDQLAGGFLAEAKELLNGPRALSRTARQALGYKELFEHIEGQATLEESVVRAERRTRQFARRQERWFRRDPRIQWLSSENNPMELLAPILEVFDRCT